MYCPNCGQQLPDSTKFCINCGKALQIVQKQPTSNYQPVVTATPVAPPPINQIPVQPMPTRRKPWYKRWWIWVILGVVSLAFISYIGKTNDISQSKSYNNQNSSITSKPTDSPPTEDPEVTKSNYMNSCETIDYDTLARNPDNYIGQHFKFTGKVIQVAEATSWLESTTLRINVTKGKYSWDDTIICTVDIPKGADRILEDDIIDIYGECKGLYTYKSIFSQSISVPRIDIKYYSINE